VNNRPISQALFLGVSLCFFISGAAGLVYQVAWSKSLGLIFGNTVYATATVLAVFMGGLALGSALLGRWSDRRVNAVALYGWIELAVAAAGALSLLGLTWVRSLYLAAHPVLGGSTAALVALRFLGAGLVLFLPTFLMGGTLPILVNGLTRTSEELGARVSRLYWVNTLGAVAGTFGSGFWLIPRYGLRFTVAVAVALNILAGVISLALSKLSRQDAAVTENASAAHEAPGTGRPEHVPEGFLLGAFAAVGATAMVYEICWTRLLATTIGSSTYAFTLMLGTFLAGLVLGSAVFERWLARGREITLGTFAATQTVTALAALAFIVFFQRLPELVPLFLRGAEGSFEAWVKLQFTVSALAMLPAALGFGFNFPVVTMLIAGRPGSTRHGAGVGRACAANTLGAIAGAVLAGFWLVPLAGAFRLVGFAAAVNVLLALLLLAQRTPRRIPTLALHGAVLLFVGWVAVSGAFYNRDLSTFNAILYWDRYNERLSLAEMAATNDVVFAEDGLNANISVVRSEDYISLRTNGKVDASNQDVLTQLLLGHIGGAFHPAPRRALVIGFGSGMTVAALAAYQAVERITVVEIEPAVIRAAPLLESLNRGILRDARVRVVLEDARSFLLTTREQFDVIISEPSNPWIAGVATLFTDEYYREARARLAPGGMFVQWVQAYSLFPEDFRMVLGTLAPHFAQASLWRGESSDYILVGLSEPRLLTLEGVRAGWHNAAIRADYERLGISRPEGFLAFHRLDDVDLRQMIGAVPKNTDDHTRLEYNAPRALLAAGIEDKNRAIIWQHRSAAPRDVHTEDAPAALLAAAETLLNLEETDDAENLVGALKDAPESAALHMARGRLLFQRSKFASAREAFKLALALDPQALDPAVKMGIAARKQFDYASAELLFRQVLNRDPDGLSALEGMFALEKSRQRYAAAAQWRERLVEAQGFASAEDWKHLGEMYLQAGNHAAAEKSFRALLAVEPYSYSGHRNLGEMLLLRQDWQGARPLLEFVVRFNPDQEAKVYRLLAQVYRNLGRLGDARSILEKGRRIFPNDTSLK
jgi:spermidine synthase